MKARVVFTDPRLFKTYKELGDSKSGENIDHDQNFNFPVFFFGGEAEYRSLIRISIIS